MHLFKAFNRLDFYDQGILDKQVSNIVPNHGITIDDMDWMLLNNMQSNML